MLSCFVLNYCMRKMRPIWARLSVRIQDRFLAVPQESAFPKGALFFLLKSDLSFAWMPFEVGASRLQYYEGLACYLRLQAGMPPKGFLLTCIRRRLKHAKP